MTTSSDRPWLASYPAGVPAEIDVNEFSSITQVLETSCERFRHRPAYTNMGRTLSFDDIDRLSRQFACYLVNELKLAKGDRVAIMLPNVLQYPVAVFGILRAGLVVVNTNPLYTARELKHQLGDSGAKAIVVLDNFAATLAEIVAQTSVKTVITSALGDMLAFPKSAITNLVVKHVKKMVPPYRSTMPCASTPRWVSVRAAACQRSSSVTTTSPSCSTPAAPPAWPRARC